MHRVSKSTVVPLSAMLLTAALLMAADPAWKAKPIVQWSEADAKQVLANSPWVGRARPALLPLRNEYQHRDGGQMGASQGVGFGALNGSVLTGIGQQPTHGKRPTMTEPLEIRWESAASVRAAEVKAHEQDAPEVASDVYAIAVYDVPGLDSGQRTLPAELKRDAFLKSEGRKDRRPSHVDVLPQGNGLTTVVYMFPRTDEITPAEKRVTFTALFGRLSVAQYFYIDQMLVQGKLEL